MTIGICIALVVMLIITNENMTTFNRDINETLNRINMIIAIAIPLSLCIKLIFEKRKTNINIQVLVYAIGVVALIIISY